MEKHKSNLVYLPGCEGCGKQCKYNAEVADPFAAAHFDRANPYGCNSKLQNLEIEEGVDNE